MKRNLLLLAGVLTIGAAFAAETPDVYPGCVFAQMSPDGNLVVSDDGMGALVIIDRTTDDYSVVYDEDLCYALGVGNAVANDGTIVVSSTWGQDDAAYVKDGVLYALPVKDEDTHINSAQAISADGSRICGGVGTSEWGLDGHSIMQIPVIWDRNEDGSYGMYQILPHPTTDFRDRTPQYITATCISADGKTIAGQVRDYQGFYHQPIVYQQDAEGNWSYTLLMNDVFAPEGVVWPELPEFAGEYPDAEDFMTAEEKAAYEQALEDYQEYLAEEPKLEDFMTDEEYAEWQEAVENWDVTQSPFPPSASQFMTQDEIDNYNAELDDWYAKNPGQPYADEFLTGESKEAYLAALAAYQEYVENYYEALDEYDAIVQELSANIPSFVFNLSQVSPNGRFLSTVSEEREDFWSPSIYTPYIFDLETGEITVKDFNALTTWVGDKGELLVAHAFTPIDPSIRNTYILLDREGEFEAIQDFIQRENPELYQWMDENMRHDYTDYVYDEEWGSYEPVEVEKGWFTGTSVASSDLSVIASWEFNIWDEYAQAYWFSYILPTQFSLGFSSAVQSSLKVKTLRGGIVCLNGQANLAIYDLSGRMVFSAADATGTIATGLKHGMYVVKATDANGITTIIKTAF